jgi:hypothetical protein
VTTVDMDALCAEVVSALRRAGLDVLVLKGPSIAQWLYDPPAARAYSDIDVLVDPHRLQEAGDVLFSMGFLPPAPSYTEDVPGHALAWHRERDQAWVDLHYTLLGAGVTHDRVWDELWARRSQMQVGGVAVDVLDETGRALHLTMHLAQDHLGQPKKLEDLRRALTVLREETWEGARALAEVLGAAPAMGAGLRQLPDGARLAARLDLPHPDHVDLIIRSEGAPIGTDTFDWFTTRPGMSGKVRFALAKAFPPPWFIRSWTPIASRYGVLGLGAGYAKRALWLARRTPPAALAWMRARRTLQRTRSMRS